MPPVRSQTAEAIRSRRRRAQRTADQQQADSDALRVRRQLARGTGLSLSDIQAYRPAGLSTPWRPLPCPHCGCRLMLSERLTWCCNNGAKLLAHLPPLPNRIQHIIDTSCDDVSTRSRELNNMFALSAIGVSNGITSGWSRYTGAPNTSMLSVHSS